MSPSKKNWQTNLQEISIGLLLMFGGLFLAAYFHNFVTPSSHFAYVYWFALMMAPFLFFARARGVVSFDRWDIVCSIPAITCIAIAATLSSLTSFSAQPLVFYGLCAFGFFATCKLRGHLPGRKINQNVKENLSP